MPRPVLATKLFRPPPRPGAVVRPRLIERLNDNRGPRAALTLVSAPAGFGKSTLLSAWVDQRTRRDPTLRVAWLSLDEGEGESAQFLLYLAAALHAAEPSCGADAMSALQSPQPPSAESVLTDLINEIDGAAREMLLVLDDFHAVHSTEVDEALAFLLEHLPARLRLVVATREDPLLPLARLRFTVGEASEFLGCVMGLELTAEHVAALESRTEGWIAGLQLAALSMSGQDDVDGFIQSFTGSHRFVMDYLIEEVLQRQPECIQSFLLRTSILDRLCGPLCDALLLARSPAGQETLENLERANLFIVPLDDERRWYRYHHLFVDLLRQKLRDGALASAGEGAMCLSELHGRASQWFEENGLDFEAFHHAAAANDLVRAERPLDGRGIPLHRSATTAVLRWFESLPKSVLYSRPSLLVKYAHMLLAAGQTAGVEEKLQAAEAALRGAQSDAVTLDLLGMIAAKRAMVALTRYEAAAVLTLSRRALECLNPDNLIHRFAAVWTLGWAHLLQGDRTEAGRVFREALAISRASGVTNHTAVAMASLGQLQEYDTQLRQAAETYRSVLHMYGDYPQPTACEAHVGLARICYEWNDLDAAEKLGRQSLQLARLYDERVDRTVIVELFLARCRLTRGDVDGAVSRIAGADESVRRWGFAHRVDELAAAQVLVLLRQGNAAEAARVAEARKLPVSRARVLLAQGDASAALALLEPWRREVQAKGWQDERLKATILEALAHHVRGDTDDALRLLADALKLAEPGGYIRVFVDEGSAMVDLLTDAADRGVMPASVTKLLAAGRSAPDPSPRQPLVEPLSQRELEVLRLIAQGLSNQEIGERLFIALDTVKGHNRRIFDKLEVTRRTEAVARARELTLL